MEQSTGQAAKRGEGDNRWFGTRASTTIVKGRIRAFEGTPRHTRRDHGRANENNQDQHTEGIRSGEPGKRTVRTDGKLNSKPEMGLQSVKCFKCSKLGHIAKDCPEKRQNQPTRRIVLSEETDGSQDPWLLMLSTEAMHKHQPDTVEPCLCTVTMSHLTNRWPSRDLHTKQRLMWTV